MTEAGAAVRLGVSIPAANTTLEVELPRFGPELASWHFQRFGQMIREEADLDAGMDSIVESGAALAAARVTAIGVGYTAGSYTGGPRWDASLRAALAARAGCPAHTAASAIVDALNHMQLRSVAVVSPYSAEVNRRAARYLTASGVNVTRVVGQPPPGPAGDVALDDIDAIVHDVERTGADAVLISCTGLRTLDLIADLEQSLDMPVLSSNLALLWAITREAGLGLSGPGSLVRDHRATS